MDETSLTVLYLVAAVLFILSLGGLFHQETARRGNTWGIAGMSIALIGMLGDLSISLFKRDVGQKDSANWLPGLGGCLDVLDSVLRSAPVGYLCWVTGCLG